MSIVVSKKQLLDEVYKEIDELHSGGLYGFVLKLWDEELQSLPSGVLEVDVNVKNGIILNMIQRKPIQDGFDNSMKVLLTKATGLEALPEDFKICLEK